MYSHVEPDPLVLGPVLDSAALEGVWHLGHHVRERDYGPPSPLHINLGVIVLGNNSKVISLP